MKTELKNKQYNQIKLNLRTLSTWILKDDRSQLINLEGWKDYTLSENSAFE